MAGTHEENMKNPAWLTEQLKQAKAQRDALQEKHDAQLKGIEEDKKTIFALTDAMKILKEKNATLDAALTQEIHNRGAERIQSGDREAKLTEELRQANEDYADLLKDRDTALALAKSRRTALAAVMNVISPVLAGE